MYKFQNFPGGDTPGPPLQGQGNRRGREGKGGEVERNKGRKGKGGEGTVGDGRGQRGGEKGEGRKYGPWQLCQTTLTTGV